MTWLGKLIFGLAAVGLLYLAICGFIVTVFLLAIFW